MSRAQEHAPTEPQPPVPSSETPTPSAVPPVAPRRRRFRAGAGGYDPVSRISLVIIAAVLVIFLILALAGFPFHVKVDKGGGGKGGGRHNGPKVTHSANPYPAEFGGPPALLQRRVVSDGGRIGSWT
jgi:hypothetical protein